MDIAGKTVLITGGAKGIGRNTAECMLDAGANVCIFDVDKEALAAISRDLPSILTFDVDISDPVAVRRTLCSVFDHFNSVDILINNAGYIHSAPLVSIGVEGIKSYPLENWEKTVNTNLNAVFYVSSPVIEKMLAQRTSGLIINISSICAAGNAGQSAYSATKAAVNALTVTWAKELGMMGIRVAGVAPGFTLTETTKSAISESTLSDWKRKTPLRRLGLPAEISKAVMFIVENDFFNGRIIEVDGGLRI